MPITEKEFMLRHVFKNVSSMKEDVFNYSEIEEHSGFQWKIGISKNSEHSSSLDLHLFLDLPAGKWSILADYELKLTAVTGKWRFKTGEACFKYTNGIDERSCSFENVVLWNEMKKNYVVDGHLTVEAFVKIKKITGIEKKKLRNFDESNKNYSDVVLVVKDQKFYVSKLYLASQSTFFENLFLSGSEESKKEEISLSGIDGKNFQNFLELLHGESPVDESTIKGILHLAHTYAAKVAIRKCEQFLIENSEKSLKEKLKLAHRYRLNNLKDYCLSKINTAEEVRSVLIYDLKEMEPDVVGALLQKSLSLIP